MATDNRRKRSSKKNSSGAPAEAGHQARPPRRSEPAAPGAVGATSGIPVIGLGGSAGALESFNAFFEAMPADSGAAFVVIQHLAPAHVSLLTELLAQRTTMKVVEAEADVPVEPNCVYVIPPSKYLGIRDGVLSLSEPVMQSGIRMPIDFFFRSLAEDRQERGVCVLFSGAGSDGTLGVRAIRGAGGLTLAQDPQTAQYGDMPRSAIATKMVDFVLPVEEMPQAITDYLRQPYVHGGEPADVLAAEDQAGGYNEILSIVLTRASCDFRCYKKSTILRRIERRMGLHHLTDLAAYSTRLRQDAGEVGQLLKDLLINVTAFFRDTEAFEELRRQALAPLVAGKPTDEPLRVWVAGCSTGEEVYSLVMLLMEEMSAARKNCPVQIFATDIDEDALATARLGLYPESIAADVGPERLTRFFIRKEQGYQVSETLRSVVVFADQNLITDPPFSKMDLISCRNLLIYLDTDTQARLIPLFNFALNPGGFLFLGKSEGVGGQSDLFSPISKQARLFRRATPARPVALDTPILPGKRRIVAPLGPPAAKPATTAHAELLRQALLSHFAASVVLVDVKGQILQFHGPMGKYLETPAAEPRLNLLESAKEGLALRLRSALHVALDEARVVVLDNVPITHERNSPVVRVTVQPLAHRGSTALPAGIEASPLLAVIFEDTPRPCQVGAEPPPCAGSEQAIQQLEDELRATQQDLQSSVEELQAANEEMRVSNEEVVSANEELQSTNEELETSKEELQSINEELTTVNSQLQEKVEQLDATNSDLANLLSSTQIATLFLDRQLRIKFFTPATTQLFKLIRSDTGRPIGDLSVNFVDFDLEADARSVAQGGAMVERDVRHADGSYYLVRVLPYRTPQGQTDGVVATFADVSRLRRGEFQYRELVQNASSAIIRWKRDGTLTFFNEFAETFFGYKAEEVVGQNVNLLVPPRDSAGTDLATLISDITANPAKYANNVNENICRDGRRVWLAWTNKAILDEKGQVAEILAVGIDITARRQAEEAVREVQEQNKFLADIVEASSQPFAVGYPDGRLGMVNRAFEQLTGYSNEELTSLGWETLTPPQWQEVERQKLEELHRSGQAIRYEKEYIRKDGTRVAVELLVHLVRDVGGKPLYYYSFLTDITARKRAEEAERKLADAALRLSEKEFLSLAESMPQIVWATRPDGGNIYFNHQWVDYTGLTMEESYGHGWNKPFHPDDQQRAREAWQRATKYQETYALECRLRRADGIYRWWLIRGVPMRGENGEILKWFGTCTDIEDLKTAEAALKGANELLEQRVAERTEALREAKDRLAWVARLPEESPSPILRASGDGLTLYCNPASAAMPEWQCRIDEPVSTHLRPLVYAALAGGTESQHELLLGNRWYSISIVPVPEGGYANIYGRDITLRKQAEEALQEREEQLSIFVDHAPAAIAMFDTQMRYLAASQRWLADFGLSGQDLVGRSHYEVFPEISENWRAIHNRCLAGAVERADEDRFERADGSVQWIRWECRPWRRASGAVGGVVLFSEEITERKKAEEALRQSEERFRTMADSIPQLAWIARADGFIYWYNQRWYEYTGTTAEQMEGWGWQSVHDPELLPSVLERWKASIASGRPFDMEFPLRGADGQFRPFLTRGVPLKDAQGRVMEWFGTNTEITEIKRTEEALRASEHLVRERAEELAVLLEAVPVPIFIAHDKECLHLSGNRLADEILRIPNHGHELSLSGPEKTRPAHFKALKNGRELRPDELPAQRACRGEQVKDFEFTLAFDDGLVRQVLGYGTPLLDAEGRPRGTVSSLIDITARKRAEEALQTTTQRLYRILAGMYSGVLLVTDEGRVEFANQAFCDVFKLPDSPAALVGLDAPAMIKKIWSSYLNPSQAVARINEILAQRQPVKGEEVAMADGSVCLRSFVPLTVDGKSFGRLWVHFDITELKRAEEAVQHSESILRAITDNSPDPMFLKDRNGRLIFANPATLRAIGKPAAEVIGKTDEEFYDDPAIGRAITANDRRIMETGRDETVEEVIPNPDGSKRLFLSTKSLLRDTKGQIIGTIGVARDITERHRAEDALRQSEERYRTMFTTMLEGFCIIEVLFDAENRPVDYRFLEINPAFEAQTGLHDAQGKLISELAPENEAHWYEIYGKVALTGEPARFTNEAKFLNRWFDVSAYRVGDPASHKVAIIFSDITDRQRTEQALLQTAEELARSNKELEQFAYVASHDLQEPLRGVIGFTKLLQERYQGRLDARADEYIGFATEGATRMNALILDLLSYSRVGSKGQAFLPTDLEAPLFRALGNLKTSIEESGAEITRDELPTVPADPGQITQLFQNLIGNAIKFHGEKKPEIHVGAKIKDGQWLFSIRDNGIGLDMKHKERIFQIFQRLHARDTYPGTGIGLAICKKIVEGHGGHIWIESQPGQGTTFFFTLSEGKGSART